MGKGLMTLHPFHSDRLVLSPVALGGVLTMLIACFDMKNTILDKVSCSIVVLPVVALSIIAVAVLLVVQQYYCSSVRTSVRCCRSM
jgi:hypothetical protein